MAPLADRETREFVVDVEMKELPKSWIVGQRAEVYIETAKKDQALLIPPGAIVWENGKPGVFVSDAGHARWRSITLGLRGTKGVEVTEGVAAGDLVVWMRDPKGEALAEGRAVTPVTR
jgi:HlyD family secretion protein